MGMHERFLSVDFRSIQQHLSAPGNSAINPIGPLSSWLLGSNTSTGTMRNSLSATATTTTQALLKSWQLHQKSMGDHILLAFQAESALDGVRCWQTGNLRLDEVQNLLRGVSEHRVSTTTRKLRRGGNSLVGAAAGAAVSTETPTSNSKEKSIGNIPRNVKDEERLQELEPDALGIAWKAYQLLQWGHARAPVRRPSAPQAAADAEEHQHQQFANAQQCLDWCYCPRYSVFSTAAANPGITTWEGRGDPSATSPCSDEDSAATASFLIMMMCVCVSSAEMKPPFWKCTIVNVPVLAKTAEDKAPYV